MQKPLYCCDEYTVDSAGFVLSKKGRPLKPYPNRHGYLIINLMIDGKRVGMSVHKAVARTFLPETYAPGLQVNHKDGNKLNNSVENLEWVTGQANIDHAKEVLGVFVTGKNHCKAVPVSAYDKQTGELKMEFGSMIDAAKYIAEDSQRIESAKHMIASVVHGRKKSYKGYVWKIGRCGGSGRR